MSIVDDRLEALKARIELLDYIDWVGEAVVPNHDDRALVSEVKAALAKRELTLDDLADMRAPHKQREDEVFRKRMERWTLQNTTGLHNKLFAVANTSHMRIDVIAMGVETATDFAVRAGHVRSAKNETVSSYNDSHVQKLVSDGSALGHAVREGVPGVVEKRGKNVLVGERVFTPITVV